MSAESIKRKSCGEKCKAIKWWPRTRSDWISVTMLTVNIIFVNVFTWCSTFLFTPEYIGITCGTWVGVIEISIVLCIKYE